MRRDSQDDEKDTDEREERTPREIAPDVTQDQFAQEPPD